MTQWTTRVAWIGATVILFWIDGTPTDSLSQSNPTQSQPQAIGSLQTVVAPGTNGSNQVIILDPTQRSLAVYSADNDNLPLLSVRSLVWDLRMEEFNGIPPLPSKLRRVQPQ